MKQHLRNSFTARETLPIGDRNDSPSMSEPDQTLSIRKLIERHVQGVDMGVNQYEPLYIDEEIPNFESMDLEELAQYRQLMEDNSVRLKKELKLRRKADKEAYLKKQESSVIDSDDDNDDSDTTP